MSSHADNNGSATSDMAITSVAAALAAAHVDGDIPMAPIADGPVENVAIQTAIQHRDHSWLYILDTPESFTARDVMASVIHKRDEVISGMDPFKPVHDFFWKQEVGIGTLTLVST